MSPRFVVVAAVAMTKLSQPAAALNASYTLATGANVSSGLGKTCSDLGGCSCDCSWASGASCGTFDPSCCFSCCCYAPPGPGPSPSPGPSGSAKYCPGGQDFNIDYGSPQLNSNGWRIQGGGRVSSKASYNFAGGFVEFDMDLSQAHGNVNNNLYVTFPPDGHSYCDSGPAGGCAEFDYTENNGACYQATTWHTDRGGGQKGGTGGSGSIGSQVHIRVTYNADGSHAAVDVGGNHHEGEGFADVMSQHGAVIYSSQWTGWVPGNCGGDGNLGASSFSVSNIRIQGTVVQGPEPTLCNNPPSPTPSPTPSPLGPTPAPSPTPPGAGQCCMAGCGSQCQGGWCGLSQANCEGNCKGTWCPSQANSIDIVV